MLWMTLSTRGIRFLATKSPSMRSKTQIWHAQPTPYLINASYTPLYMYIGAERSRGLRLGTTTKPNHRTSWSRGQHKTPTIRTAEPRTRRMAIKFPEKYSAPLFFVRLEWMHAQSELSYWPCRVCQPATRYLFLYASSNKVKRQREACVFIQ